ncbi:hypothetical protein ACRS52_12365 [Bacillus cytotoxicus]|uniref:Uncharacterized protein n=1 Tax=Bacillus cytotoxicus TaxID=580165 RepID=A0AAX2CH90_9BACI|nr:MULTISPECIES: hypothetical protein [Bacillus cereus group]SCL90328.1 Protein of unknown function [Bacillus cytotoxicus]
MTTLGFEEEIILKLAKLNPKKLMLNGEDMFLKINTYLQGSYLI